MHIPSNSRRCEYLIAQPGWWIMTRYSNKEITYEPVVAWQRIENTSNLAGGALFPVTAAGTMCFPRCADEDEIIFIPVEKMEWINGNYYRVKKEGTT